MTSTPTVQAVRTCPPPGSNEGLAGFNRARYRLRQEDGCVEKVGLEPTTFGLPSRRATNCATTPCVWDPRVERGVFCLQSRRVPVSLVPDVPGMLKGCPYTAPGDNKVPLHAGVLLSTVEFSSYGTRANEGMVHGRQELNPQPTVLEAAALPVELRPQVLVGNEKAARSGVRWAATACVDR